MPQLPDAMTLPAAPAPPARTAAADFEAEFKARLHWSAETDAAIEQAVADDPGRRAGARRRGGAGIHARASTASTPPACAALELTRGRAEGRLRRAARRRSATRSRPPRAACAATTRRQKKASGESWSYRDDDGTLLGQKVTPLDRVGIYVPGGKAAYPSSVLMNAIPAHVAGVGEIIMVVPTPRGEKNPLVLAAAYVAGVHRAFTIGGAQAVAALAYGTATDPGGRQDHRPRQRLRGQRQAPRVRHRSAST